MSKLCFGQKMARHAETEMYQKQAMLGGEERVVWYCPTCRTYVEVDDAG